MSYYNVDIIQWEYVRNEQQTGKMFLSFITSTTRIRKL